MRYPKLDWLRDCRDALGEPPRSFGLWERLTYLRVPFPGWASHDRMRVFFDYRARLLREGFVTWGHFVQANYRLFKNGPYSHPAEIVFGLDPDRDPDPADLEAIAMRLFNLKEGPRRDPEEAAVGRHLASEMKRAFGLRVPRSFGAPHRLAMSTVYVYRPHLPGPRYLTERVIPLLVCPTRPRIVMPVPGRYWPEPLKAWWAGE